jgi:ribonucleoside-diphosphate reductase subunit M1
VTLVVVSQKDGKPVGMILKEMYEVVQANAVVAAVLDSAIIYNRDFHYN